MDVLLLVIYWSVGYWAVGEIFYANKIVIYSGNTLFIKKAIIGLSFGWLLIPIAIIKKILIR